MYRNCSDFGADGEGRGWWSRWWGEGLVEPMVVGPVGGDGDCVGGCVHRKFSASQLCPGQAGESSGRGGVWVGQRRLWCRRRRTGAKHGVQQLELRVRSLQRGAGGCLSLGRAQIGGCGGGVIDELM